MNKAIIRRAWVAAATLTALISPASSWGQGNTFTDSMGTTFLNDGVSDTKIQQVRQPRTTTSSTNTSPGALRSDRQNRRIGQDPNYTGINIGPTSDGGELLLNQLLGVVLVPTPGDVRPEGWRGVEGVWHDFKDFPPEVGWVLQRYLRKPVSLSSLDKMVKDVIIAYRESDRPVVDVLLPEQDITQGVVQLVVIESKLGRVRIEGVDTDTEEYIRSQLRVRKGDVIRSSEVLYDLAWLNRSPYRKVDLAYSPGRDFGTTDLILKPSYTKKNSFFVGYEDSGTANYIRPTGPSDYFLGRDRFLWGFNMGEFMGDPTQSLAYQMSSDFDFEDLIAQSVVYSKDLPWRHNLTLMASFADINGDLYLGPPLGFLNTKGFNWQLSARYNIPLKSKETYLCEPIFGTIQRKRDMYYGFDFKSNQNNAEFGAFPGLFNQNQQVEIYQFVAGYQEVWQHPNGVSQLELVGYLSPGGFSSHNTDRTFDSLQYPNSGARWNSDPRYAYATASFEHQHRLIQDWSYRTRMMGQIANGNLQVSEQFGAGGYDLVRGFDQRIIRGDEGFYWTNEIWTPEISLARILDWTSSTDSLRFLAFVDTAAVSNVFLQPGIDANSQTIASVGVGMRWRYNDFFNLRVDYGKPVMTALNPNTFVNESGRFHIGATATF